MDRVLMTAALPIVCDHLSGDTCRLGFCGGRPPAHCCLACGARTSLPRHMRYDAAGNALGMNVPAKPGILSTIAPPSPVTVRNGVEQKSHISNITVNNNQFKEELYSNWPSWAQAIADMREPEDIGVGSTIGRKLAESGILFKATLKSLGVECGCDKRKKEYNIKYPYSQLK